MNHHDDDDRIAMNHQRKQQISKCKSVLKKRKRRQPTKVIQCHIDGEYKWILCAFVALVLPYLCECQFTTRDPRWYSREGDFNYQWPNPGDPDYR